MLNDIVFKIKSTIKHIQQSHYKFPKNQRGEFQVWVPYVMKNKDRLVDLVRTFNYTKFIINKAYERELPEVVEDFFLEHNLINPDSDGFEELIGLIYLYFSNLNMRIPIPNIHSTTLSGILPDLRFESNVNEDDQHEIFVKLFKDSDTAYENDDIDSWNFDCPFCKLPYNFNNPEALPKKNFLCGGCGSVLIQYIGKDTENIIPYEYNDDTLKYLKKFKLKRIKVEENKEEKEPQTIKEDD